MNTISRGFTGRRQGDVKLPPGQYLEHGFPVLQTGPTPSVRTATWTFTITTETGEKIGRASCRERVYLAG